MIAKRAAWILMAIEREVLDDAERHKLEAIEENFKREESVSPSTGKWLECIFEVALWRGWGEGAPGE